MEQLFSQYPWLVIIAAILIGMVIMWLLEMFVLRRQVKGNITELEASLKQRDSDLQTTQSTLKQSNQELKTKGDELQTALTARAAADKQLADAKTQLAKSGADLDAAVQSRQQLETTLNARSLELNEQRAKFAALATERDQLRTTLATTKTELEDTRAHQRGAVAEVAKLSALAAATAATVKGLEHSKSELTEQLTSSNSELGATRLRVGDLEGINNALGERVAELQTQNSALDSDVAKLTAGALAAAELIKQLEGDKTALTEQHTQLQGDFESLERAKGLDDAELAEVKLHLNEVNDALGITMRDKESYRDTLATRVGELGEAQTQLVQAKQDNSGLLGDVAKFTARAAAAALLVQELESNKRDLTGQVEQLRGDLDTERAQVAALTQAAQAPAPDAPVESAETGTEETLAEPELAAQTLDAGSANGSDPEDRLLPFEAVCPQDLSVVQGIGAQFEQRLYNAGIGTYWEMAQCSEEELARVLEVGDSHHSAVNLAGIRGDALRLARETKSQHRKWKGGVPDDFDLILGIGQTIEGRLYEAGICTYEALAACSVEQLVTLCHAPQFNLNHYQGWIEKAAALAEARRQGA